MFPISATPEHLAFSFLTSQFSMSVLW